jgi:hypothetical protein
MLIKLQETLDQLTSFFESNDSIMEPQLLTKMAQFIANGGQPAVLTSFIKILPILH